MGACKQYMFDRAEDLGLDLSEMTMEEFDEFANDCDNELADAAEIQRDMMKDEQMGL